MTANRDLVRRLLDRWLDPLVFAELTTDDLVFDLKVNPAVRGSHAGEHSRDEIIGLRGRTAARLAGGFRMCLQRIVADGDSVVAEVVAVGRHQDHDGASFRIPCTLWFEFRGGLIARITEYTDSAYGRSVN